MYIGPKSRTERPRKIKIGTEVAHVTRDSDTTFKIKRSGSPGRFAHRRVGASGGYSSGRENVLAVRNCCYCRLHSRRKALRRPLGEERGGPGHTVAAARLQLVIIIMPPSLG